MRGKRNARKGNAPRGATRIILAAVTASGMFGVGGATAAPIVATWNIDADGHWSDVNAWTGGVPGNVGDIALFTSPTTAARTITLDQPFTVSALGFDSANGYTVGGTNSLRLQGASNTNNAYINVTASNGAGVHIMSTPIDLATNVTIVIDAGSGLTLAGPVHTAGFSQPFITVHGGGALTLAAGSAGTHRVTSYNIYDGELNIESDGALGNSQNVVNVYGNSTVRLTAGMALSHQFSHSNFGTNGGIAFMNIPSGTVSIAQTGNFSGPWVKTGAGTLRTAGYHFDTSLTMREGQWLIDPPTTFGNGPNAIYMEGGSIAPTTNGISRGLTLRTGTLQIGDPSYPYALHTGILLAGNLPQYTLSTPPACGVFLDGGVGDNAHRSEVVFSGGGTFTMQGNPSTNGNTRLEDGILILKGTSAGGNTIPGALFIGASGASSGISTALLMARNQINDAADLTIFSNGVFDLNGFSETVRTLNGEGQVHLPGSLALRSSTTSVSKFSGTFSGSGAVSLQIFGSTTLDGPSPNFSGSFSAGIGSLTLGSNATLGTARLMLGDFEISSTTVRAAAAPVLWSNPTEVGLVTFDGAFPMRFGPLLNANTIVTNVDTTFAGAARLTKPFIKSGTATLTIGQPGLQNFFTGLTSVNDGTLRLANGGRSTNVTGDDYGRLFNNNNGFRLNNAVLDLTAAGTNITPFSGTLFGKNATVLGSLDLIQGALVSGTNLTITGDVIVRDFMPTGTISTGNLSFFPVSSPTMEIPIGTVIGGTGTASNSSLRVLTINGTLNKPLTTSTTIRGTGTIGGSLTLFSPTPAFRPTLLPGNSNSGTGALHTGTLTLTSGAFYKPVVRNIPDYVAVDVTGEVNLLDASLLPSTSLPQALFPDGACVIIRNDGVDPIIGRFKNLPNDGDTYLQTIGNFQYTMAIDYHYDASGDGGNNDVAVHISVQQVPEPSGVLMSVGTLASLALWRRRARTGVLK